MTSNDRNKDVALKAWDVYQGLAKAMGESAWKIQSISLGLGSGLVAYSYSSGLPDLYLVVSMLSVLFCLMESGYRRLQYQYIAKSNAIELTLNDFIAKEEHPRFPDSIGTDVDTPSWEQLKKLFRLKRVMFWLPYMVQFVFPIVLWLIKFQRPG